MPANLPPWLGVLSTLLASLRSAPASFSIFVRGTGFLDHTPAPLGQPMLWGGFAFVFVLTQLTVWPAAYYLRKLPVLNKML